MYINDLQAFSDKNICHELFEVKPSSLFNRIFWPMFQKRLNVTIVIDTNTLTE